MEKLRAKVSFKNYNDKQYVVLEALDYDDLIAQGETFEEAYKELEENFLSLVEFYDEINKQLKKKKIPTASGRVLLRFSKRIHQFAINRAEEEGVSLNQFINDAISFYIGYQYKEVQDEQLNKVVAQCVRYNNERSYNYVY